ncbi:MAG: tRNA (adenosine(37)-N6)-dimethylallyltransferase MiaA [Hyphomicrobiaceae bacterium]
MSTNHNQRPILIAGPTASGKSGLAVALAERLGGVVINSDSMQVYREVPILSAQPTMSEQMGVRHRLYGDVSGAEAYSAARFAREAGAEIARAQAEGLRPIIVGGTGLYFMALTEGLSPIPEIAVEVRAHWRGEARRLGAGELYALLMESDPVAAERLNPADHQRVTRALEVLHGTGRSLVEWQAVPGVPVVRAEDCSKLVLVAEREALGERCDRRFDQMLETGALEEARRFAALGLDAALPVWGALGLRQLVAVEAGEMTLEAAAAASKLVTRQFVKRQQTWFKRNMITWNVVQMKYLEKKDADNLSFVDVAMKLL